MPEAPKGTVRAKSRWFGAVMLAIVLAFTSSPLLGQGGTEVAMVLLVDSSGSMSKSDPSRLRLEAVRLFLDSLPPDTLVGIIDFDDKHSVIRDLEQLGGFGSASRSSTKERLSSIDSEGGTDIDRALQAALRMLADRGPAKTGFVILLSDGQDTKPITALQEMKARKIRIHTIGLSDQIDMGVLPRISSDTGGVHEVARNAADLARIYASISATCTNRQMITTVQETMRQGAVIEKTFPIEGKVGSLTALVSWPGSDIGMEIIDPTNVIYGVPSGAAAGQAAGGNTYRVVHVDAPKAGMWRCRLYGTQIDKSGEQFVFGVMALSDTKVEWTIKPEAPKKGERIRVTYRTNQSNVEWMDADVNLLEPSGNTTSRKVTTFGRLFSPSATEPEFQVPQELLSIGIYRLTVILNGRQNDTSTPLQRAFDKSFVVDEAKKQRVLDHIPRGER